MMNSQGAASTFSIGVVHPYDRALITSAPFPNALFIGPHEAVRGLLAGLLPDFQPVIALCAPFIDGTTPERGTCVLWNVDRLTPVDQGQLLDFLDEGRDLQILSVSTRRLFEHVQHGLFLERLYYRLNTVLVHVGARPTTYGPHARSHLVPSGVNVRQH